jgi:DNA-binding MarR family transcriptional regulator
LALERRSVLGNSPFLALPPFVVFGIQSPRLSPARNLSPRSAGAWRRLPAVVAFNQRRESQNADVHRELGIYVNIVDMGHIEDAPLGYLLYRVGAVLRPEVSAVLGPLGLTLPEFVCLRILSMSPGLSSAELSRNTNVTPQAMNTVLRRLEEIGAVARPESVSSGRALPATLTASGRTLLKRAEGAVRVADSRILAKLTPAQQREFKRVLDKLGAD